MAENYDGFLKLATAASARKAFEVKCDSMAATVKLMYQAAAFFKDKDMANTYYNVAAGIWDELGKEVFRMFPKDENDNDVKENEKDINDTKTLDEIKQDVEGLKERVAALEILNPWIKIERDGNSEERFIDEWNKKPWWQRGPTCDTENPEVK